MRRSLLFLSLVIPMLLGHYVLIAQCTTPPVAGLATASAPISCSGSAITLNLSGNSSGTGQTYQWQEALVAAGPWTPVGSSSSSPSLVINPVATRYYRAAVTCSGNTQYSQEVKVMAGAVLPAGTYTINSGLPTGGTNYVSFTDAVNALSCGISGPVVFHVAAASGPYQEQIIIPAVTGASASNTITINGNGRTIKYASANTNERATIKLNGASYVMIDNLRIIAEGTYGFAVHFINNSDYNTIQNCHVQADTTETAADYAGIVMSGSATSATTTGSNCDNNLITGNHINGGYYGVATVTTNSNTISNNVVRNFYLYGIYSNVTTNGITDGNDIYRDTRTVLSTFNAIFQAGAASNNMVSRNSIHDPFKAVPGNQGAINGITMSASDATAANATRIVNNKIYNMIGGGTIYGLYNTGSDNTLFYHNTVSIDDLTYTGTGIARAFYQTTLATGIDLKNNIFSITRGGTGINYAIYRATATTTLTSNYNNFYIAGTGTNHIGYAATSLTSLANWQTTGNDINTQTADPVFSGGYIGNLSPTNVVLDGLGTPVGVAVDILNVPRSLSTPDMGAYEFTINACASTPSAGTLSELNNLTTACVGRQLAFSLSGFTVASGVVFQWESSPVGLANWTPIVGATSVNLVTTFTGAKDYRVWVNCINGGLSSASNVVTVNLAPQDVCYCSPLTGNPLHTSTGNYITNVTIQGTTLNNTTASIGTGGYTQASHSSPSNTATLAQATPYFIEVSLSSATYNAVAWIDFNNNGSFDVSEFISLNKSGTVASNTVIVPATAAPGLTGMRVRVFSTTPVTAADACLLTGFETEDYVVNIATALPCSGTPNATTANGPSAICPATPFMLSATNYSTGIGITYEWQRYNTVTTAWDVIGNTPVISVSGQTQTESYRFVTFCSFGGGNSISGTHTVTINNWFACYCLPTNSNCTGQATYITGVIFLTTNNPSGSCLVANAYSDYKALPAPVTNQGGSLAITVDVTPCSFCLGIGGTAVRTVVWIDYDHSGTFDVSEFTALAGTAGGSGFLFTGTIPIPATALTGTTGMRVRNFFGTAWTGGEACSATTYGETEDYAININFPLSIGLTDLTARNINNRNLVEWKTETEAKGDQFILERSADGGNFTALTSVYARGEAGSYSYWDESPVSGLNHYRLNMLSPGKESNYSKVVSVNNEGKGSFTIEAHPNPVMNKLHISVYGQQGADPVIFVTDVTGKNLYQGPMLGSANEIDMNDFAPGTYMLKYKDGSNTQTIKIHKR